MSNTTQAKWAYPALGLLSLLLLGALAYGYFQFDGLQARNERAEQDLASSTDAIRGLRHSISALEGSLSTTSAEKRALEEALAAEQKKNREFENQIKGIADTVGTLEKLSKTDPELLQKYSKVYFLNEHYVPSELEEIDARYVLASRSAQQLHAKILPELTDMIDEAEEDGVAIKVVSAYRSFREQASLKSGYAVTYGIGANKFSADQGYSEHQLGTTVDLTTPEVGGPYMSFEKTDAFKWLQDNAHKFGFVLSYPPGNAYYQYEPWHWRFVGTKLARQLHREGKFFYDLDQRAIDEYLVSFFD